MILSREAEAVPTVQRRTRECTPFSSHRRGLRSYRNLALCESPATCVVRVWPVVVRIFQLLFHGNAMVCTKRLNHVMSKWTS
uniref:Uncharacterized protein n=1 Tax=Steinernema glaseri TaxID=37863 RepID=A0A1I7YZ01_9BILA